MWFCWLGGASRTSKKQETSVACKIACASRAPGVPPETWCALIRPFLCITSIGNHLLVFHSEIRSIMFYRVTDHRRLSEVKGKGLVVPKPCVYIFSGLEVCRQTRSYFY